MSLQGTIKRYSLIINYTRRSSFPSFKEIHEILQGILMYTDRVRVVMPDWLRERIKIALAESVKKYSK